jgi:hypothetical protein
MIMLAEGLRNTISEDVVSSMSGRQTRASKPRLNVAGGETNVHPRLFT